MTVAALAWAQGHAKSIGPFASAVLNYLADGCSHQNTVVAPQSEISAATGIARRTIVTALNDLEGAGLITRDGVQSRGGRQPDTIVLHVGRGAADALGDPRRDANAAHGGGANAAPLETSRGAAVAHGPTGKPKENNPSANPARPYAREDSKIEGRDDGKVIRESSRQDSKNPPNPDQSISGEPTARMHDLAEQVWAATPLGGQRRTGGPNKIAWALFEQSYRGDDPETVAQALMAYVLDPRQQAEEGRYCGAPHAVATDGRWKSYRTSGVLPESGPRRPAGSRMVRLTGTDLEFESPPGCTLRDMNPSLEDPCPTRQISWLRDYADAPRQWNRDERGPTPDEEGNRIWPSVAAWWAKQQGGARAA